MSLKSFWRNYVWKTSLPWVELGYDGEKITVKDYNVAFVTEQRVKLGDLCDGKSNAEVIDLFTNRENLEREDPRLEVLHLGIEDDGRVKVKLDWNLSFIKHLKENGITGETEEEAIQNYLRFLTHNELQGDLEKDEFFSKEQLDAAFAGIDQEIEREVEEVKRQARKTTRRRKTS